MGFQATVTIYLDNLDTISKDKDFGKKLSDAILEKANRAPYGDQTVGFNAASERCSCNAGQVIVVHHSGDKATVETHGNTGKIIKPKV